MAIIPPLTDLPGLILGMSQRRMKERISLKRTLPESVTILILVSFLPNKWPTLFFFYQPFSSLMFKFVHHHKKTCWTCVTQERQHHEVKLKLAGTISALSLEAYWLMGMVLTGMDLFGR